MAETLRQPCPRADGAEAVRTVGDLAAFSVRQEAALSACEARRAALAQTIDAHNALAARTATQAQPRRWRLFGRSL
ncbi:MAG TPA: hypothetical protein VL358_01105 [Caulobacteraceae bacterium]|nr:hypothetical protein [Caulobacteraceae bacterium]